MMSDVREHKLNILVNLEQYQQREPQFWLRVSLSSLFIHVGTLGIVLFLFSQNRLMNSLEDSQIPVEIITINHQKETPQPSSVSPSSPTPNLDDLIEKTQQLETELSQVKPSAIATPKITPSATPIPETRKPIVSTPSPSPSQETRKPVVSNPSPRPSQETRKPVVSSPSPRPSQETRKPIVSTPSSRPSQETRKPVISTPSPRPSQPPQTPLASPPTSPETIAKTSPSPIEPSPNLNQEETAFRPSPGGGLIARIENLRISQANRDIIDQEASIKQTSQTFPRVDYLTSQGISLDQDLIIEVLVIIQPNGKAQLVSASGFTKISQGNLTIDQAEQLVAEILSNWTFEPPYMGNQPVARDYFVQLKISPTQN